MYVHDFKLRLKTIGNVIVLIVKVFFDGLAVLHKTRGDKRKSMLLDLFELGVNPALFLVVFRLVKLAQDHPCKEGNICNGQLLACDQAGRKYGDSLRSFFGILDGLDVAGAIVKSFESIDTRRINAIVVFIIPTWNVGEI